MQCVQLFECCRRPDAFSGERPFVALSTPTDGSVDLHPGYLHLYSIPKGTIRHIALQNPERERIVEIESNDGWVAVGTSYGRIYLINSETLQIVSVIEAWSDQLERGSGGASTRPTFALGPRWLAFQSTRPSEDEVEATMARTTGHASANSDSSNSPDRSNSRPSRQVSSSSSSSDSSRSGSGKWSKSSISAMGYAGMREAVYYTAQLWTNLSNATSPPPQNVSPSRVVRPATSSPNRRLVSSCESNSPTPSSASGTVEIWALPPLRLNQPRISRIALFSADSRPLECMSFDHSGILLATAADGGQCVKVWSAAELVNHSGPRKRSPVPKYVLQRGATLGSIRAMTWTDDSRYIAFMSHPKGTTHIFPIALSGQEVGASTHLTDKLASMSLANTSGSRGGESAPFTPAKAGIIHSPAGPNIRFSGISRLSNFPLSAEHSDQKRVDHAGDLSLWSLYSNGSLIRNDLFPGLSGASSFSLSKLSFSSSSPPLPISEAQSRALASGSTPLSMQVKPRHEWTLPVPSIDAQRPTHTNIPEANWFSEVYGLAKSAREEPQAEDPEDSSADLLAQVDIQTHAIGDSEYDWWPTLSMFAFSEPPAAGAAQAAVHEAPNWWDDSRFQELRLAAVNLRVSSSARSKASHLGYVDANAPLRDRPPAPQRG